MRPIEVKLTPTAGCAAPAYVVKLPAEGVLTLKRVGYATVGPLTGVRGSYTVPATLAPGRWTAHLTACATGCLTCVEIEMPESCRVVPHAATPAPCSPYCGDFGFPNAALIGGGLYAAWTADMPRAFCGYRGPLA